MNARAHRAKYPAYLESPEWKRKRGAAKRRAKSRCQVCNSDDQLEVHHRTYENLFDEKPSDLTVLCAHCHGIFHAKLGYRQMMLNDVTRRYANGEFASLDEACNEHCDVVAAERDMP